MPSAFYLPLIYTFTILFFFGIGWNYLVERLETAKVEGYTWVLVVGGVAMTVTLAGPLIGWQNVPILLGCFAASGAAMIVGAVRRHHLKLRSLLNRALGIDDDRQQAPSAGPGRPQDHQ